MTSLHVDVAQQVSCSPPSSFIVVHSLLWCSSPSVLLTELSITSLSSQSVYVRTYECSLWYIISNYVSHICKCGPFWQWETRIGSQVLSGREWFLSAFLCDRTSTECVALVMCILHLKDTLQIVYCCDHHLLTGLHILVSELLLPLAGRSDRAVLWLLCSHD